MQKKEEERKSDSMSEIDYCVACGAPTPFRKNDPIEMRTGYVEGCGQLCGSCAKEFSV